jgi:hypothetical protein
VLPVLIVVVAGKAVPEIEMLFGLLLLVEDVLDFEQEKKVNDKAHAIKSAKYFVFMI